MKNKYLTSFIFFILGACSSLWVTSATTIGKDKFAQLTLTGIQQTTLVSLSPNKRYRVFIVYETGFQRSDAAISIWLKDSKGYRFLYKTGINGGMGTERIIWERDGSKFWIAGRHFIGTSALDSYTTGQLPGEVIYFMYDIERNILLCHQLEFTPKNACLTEPQELLGSYPK